jgi:hypothetical protein
VAYVVSARPPSGGRTWTVVDGSYCTVTPVEEWLEAHRQVAHTARDYEVFRGDFRSWSTIAVSSVRFASQPLRRMVRLRMNSRCRGLAFSSGNPTRPAPIRAMLG